jgi:SAM-dependent methyltransferase
MKIESLIGILKILFRKIRSVLRIMRNRKAPRLESLNSINKYWEARYSDGGNSGVGSYGETAQFKASTINSILEKFDIKSVIDFGCGDGAQLKLLNLSGRRYLGIDVSATAINLCEGLQLPSNYSFSTWDGISLSASQIHKFDLAMSNDVIYHLTDDFAYENYLNALFECSNFVLIFSMNYENPKWDGHVRHRKFTDRISIQFPNFELLKVIESTIPNSKTHFYLYGKRS